MESANLNSIESSSISTSLEIQIKDFRTASESSQKAEYIEDADSDFNAWFYISAYPNGFDIEGYDTDTKGWLTVHPHVRVFRGTCRPRNIVLSWTVSVIDTEGSTRFPRSFMQDLSKDVTDAKYLEKSFILNRADEFLPEGVLTLRCDIYFQWYNTASALDLETHSKIAESVIPDVPWSDRKCIVYDHETGYSSEIDDDMDESVVADIPRWDEEIVESDDETEESIDDFASFVEKNFAELVGANRIFHEVYYSPQNIYDPPSVQGKHPKLWRFITRTQVLNVVLDDQKDCIGSRLLKASPVIRRCVEAPMKERRDKSVELPDFDSKTFKIVLYYLMKKNLPILIFDELLELYRFSHMYEMEVLQKNCSEDMVNSLDHESDFMELQKLAYFYSDKHLSELLRVSGHGDGKFETDLSNFRRDDKPYSDYLT